MALKSRLLTPVLIALSAVFALSIYRLASGAPTLPWVGVLLASAPLPVFISILMVLRPAGRTSRHLPAFLGISGLGLILTLVSAPTFGAGPTLLAAGSVAALLWYDFIYSDLDRTNSRVLHVGAPLPDFTVQDLSGAEVSSADFTGQKTLFLFYRGNWCPLCMAQIKEVAARYIELSDMGVRIALISPQPHDQTASLAANFGVQMDFLRDVDGQAAQSLEIAAPDGTPSGLTLFGYSKDTVLPTVIATDADGTIIYLDQTDNYRVRPEPDVFLEIFRGAAPAQIRLATEAVA